MGNGFIGLQEEQGLSRRVRLAYGTYTGVAFGRPARAG